MNKSIIIAGTGSYLPEKIITNHDIAKTVDTSDEWVYTRSGIKERRIAKSEEAASDMALISAKRAIENAKLKPEDIDLVIVTTVTPDMMFPSTACILQAKLGIRNNIPCFDIEAACSGFVYGVEVASKMMKSGYYKNALVVSSEKLSGILDWQDRNTCVLFGDGSGAVVLSTSEEKDVGILDTVLGADGSDTATLKLPAGGSLMPASKETVENRQHFIQMNGREVFKHAVKIMGEKSFEVIERYGITPNEISLLIPHQANTRIIESVAKRLKLPMEKVFVNIEKYGNTSSASIPIALDEALKAGKIKKGDYILFVAFGAGLTWGATLVKWH
ncbi:beta-ketoacyl-ACP synthase III [Intestinicryptomonas porci]|uniref:Beta-ketoacyl-[acyl-carrier-protein] synthase III n=1 Tax=Intestinicryptomonas porci TaxID=2926320 RepID=A0ABU4WDQ6_9BACT|nr:ketoacyl-ACP synthase III [Opitutales bacterium CLA-KB-P66]